MKQTAIQKALTPEVRLKAYQYCLEKLNETMPYRKHLCLMLDDFLVQNGLADGEELLFVITIEDFFPELWAERPDYDSKGRLLTSASSWLKIDAEGREARIDIIKKVISKMK